MGQPSRELLLVASVVMLCAALLGGPRAAASGAAPPWESAGPFPASYDLRDHGKVTGVREQAHKSTCWIIAATGSLESCLLPGALYDFSENNLANHQGSLLDFGGRADSELSTAYFARWDGPVLERQDPYPYPGASPEGLRPALHVQDVLFLPPLVGSGDNAALKWAITTYGGIDVTMCWTIREGCLDKTTFAFYAWEPGLALNHHVTCVGWDDAYPASRFATQPPGPGAYLVKNTWGTDWGLAGYFWVSYYDPYFGGEMAVFTGTEPVSNHDAIYQYDALGWSSSYGYSSETASFASRFSCAGSGTLSAVSFYTPVQGSSYEVRVARSVAEVATATVAGSGTIPVAGYHTVRLTDPQAVRAGGVFVVAVTLVTPGSSEPVPLEHPSHLIAPRASPGQSYVSPDGVSWTDLVTLPGYEHSNVCLKAFVDAAGAVDTVAPRVAVSANRLRRGAMARVRWRLTDPAFSSACAVVVLSVRDRHGLLLVRRRIPAVMVRERGTWSFRCRWRAGSYAVRARAYDVAGNRQAHASRATLTVY